MQPMLHFFFFSLLSISIHPRFLLANTIPDFQHPRDELRGNETDYEALLAIKSQISDFPDSMLSSWNNKSLTFCQWRGVTCDHPHNRVVSLDLSSSKLVGTLSPFIGNLSFLRHLDLNNNSFRGNIPTQISHLIRLQNLSLSQNFFQGEIPANLSRCLQLAFINLWDNTLGSRIPKDLATLPNLEYISLGQNNLIGKLGDIGIGNMSISLKHLHLEDNHLEGGIPNDIGRLKKGLVSLTLSGNILSGTIPTSIFNLTNLIHLFLGHNGFHGHLPKDLGLTLPQLRKLYLRNNFLTGQVPTSLSNLSKIEVLIISFNSFTGRFSLNGNNWPHLLFLDIDDAYPLGVEGQDLSFIDTLTNCTNLQDLALGGNSFIGALPNSVLNLSTRLDWLDLYNNSLSGQLPSGLGKFVNLYGFNIHSNYFTGPIPDDIGKMESIVVLDFQNNNFSGEIPTSLGNMSRLSKWWMSFNNLEGSLPKSLGNCQYLQILHISSNKLSGVLPVEILHISSLTELLIDENNLRGSLPLEISLLKNLIVLNVSYNKFSGEIPNTLGGCTCLKTIGMDGNSFVGSIPESLSPLKSIEYLNLSSNNLSGQIPSYFSTWPYLFYLDLSFNNLEGEVPLNGVFANTSALSIVGNSKLCGGVPGLHLPRCPSPRESRKRRLSLAVIISIASVSIITISVALCLYFLCSSRKRKDAYLELQNAKPFPEVSYQMLARATEGFSPSNLIGVGAFGSVYKGTLIQDDTELSVAVKVMNLQNKRASKSFIVECNALKNIRHRNLVKIITVCSSIDPQHNDFKALVYEFMPKGSLGSWLYSNLHVSSENVGDDQSCSLSLLQRLSIAIDVASVVEYLHTGCDSQIIHCDLKPTNILLDDDMTARVGDFGLAKFLSEGSISGATSQSSSTQVRGTVGYAAPEYGTGSKASVEGDIYSFGIVVLEMMTSKKPTDPMFSEGINLHGFAKSAFPDRVIDIVDQRMLGDANLLRAINGADIKKMECIKSLIMVGVKCSLEIPQDRMSINDAVNELKSMRQNLNCIRN